MVLLPPDILMELGWNIYNDNRNRALQKGLITCGAIRDFVRHYESQDCIYYYNDHITFTLEEFNCAPDLHVLDCTKVDVNVDNDDYENSTVIQDDGGYRRGL